MKKVDIRKKYRIRNGEDVEFISDAGRGTHPVVGYVGDQMDITYWTKEGNYFLDETSQFDLVEVSPYEDWKIDDKIEVSDDNIRWKKRHFAGVNDEGFPMAWNAGCSSWTEEYNGKLHWKYARKPEDA